MDPAIVGAVNRRRCARGSESWNRCGIKWADMVLFPQFIAAKKAELEQKKGEEWKLQDTMIRSAHGRAQASDSFDRRRVSSDPADSCPFTELTGCRAVIPASRLVPSDHLEIAIPIDLDHLFVDFHLLGTEMTGTVEVHLHDALTTTGKGIGDTEGEVRPVGLGVGAGVLEEDRGIVGVRHHLHRDGARPLPVDARLLHVKDHPHLHDADARPRLDGGNAA